MTASEMNKDMKGMCLALGFIGLTYVMALLVVAAFTGLKIYKSIVFITMLSSALITFGLTPQVRSRLVDYFKSNLLK